MTSFNFRRGVLVMCCCADVIFIQSWWVSLKLPQILCFPSAVRDNLNGYRDVQRDHSPENIDTTDLLECLDEV